MARTIQSGVTTRTSHLPHYELCENKEAFGCALNRLKPWVSNEEQADCVPIQNVPRVVPTVRTAVPHNTGDKMEDIVVYLPQQQENPVEGDLEDGHEIQAPEEHPPEHADAEAHDEPGPKPPALRRSTKIRQPPGWYRDRIILPDKLA